MDMVRYLHLPAGHAPPDLSLPPFKAVIVVSEQVTHEWRERVSAWLVRCGCRYVIAWGRDCGAWEFSIDNATLAAFDYDDVPDDDFVMTTSNEYHLLEEAFRLASADAAHPTVELPLTLILDIGATSREDEMLHAFEAAIAS